MEEDAMVEAFYADDGDAEMEGAEDDGEAPVVSIPVQALEEEEIL
jgi:hypothetical protein